MEVIQTNHSYRVGDIIERCNCNPAKLHHIYYKVEREATFEEFINDPHIYPDGLTSRQWAEQYIGPDPQVWKQVAEQQKFKFYVLGDKVGEHEYICALSSYPASVSVSHHGKVN